MYMQGGRKSVDVWSVECRVSSVNLPRPHLSTGLVHEIPWWRNPHPWPCGRPYNMQFVCAASNSNSPWLHDYRSHTIISPPKSALITSTTNNTNNHNHLNYIRISIRICIPTTVTHCDWLAFELVESWSESINNLILDTRPVNPRRVSDGHQYLWSSPITTSPITSVAAGAALNIYWGVGGL